MNDRLHRDFFKQPTLEVAKNLLGKVLVFGEHKGIITETEAYIGIDDPASHAARGKTPRNAVMFGEAGKSYVYFIYGMYHCFNIVTEKEGFPAAVLIRGIKLITSPYKHLNGPGKLCKHLEMTKKHSGVDIVKAADFYVKDNGYSPSYEATQRIGIKVGIELPWRFIVKSCE